MGYQHDVEFDGDGSCTKNICRINFAKVNIENSYPDITRYDPQIYLCNKLETHV